ncbi:MBL fold metallo-hydrolase [Vibrio tritonius]|uniref:MBL fold metallo-hydrolase n=1 Tax=Vibrio tritonius TaxID=1435069 RepID=UPI000837C82D|nr:MBL fold metallo-hydrolase [Vibrio tritonius]
MKIDVIGCGSALSTDLNTSAIMVSDQTQCWLIDCGPTIPRALWQRNLDINQIKVIYFTHIHPDHCAGLPALLGQWNTFKRSAPLTIYCQKPQQASLEQLVGLASWPDKAWSFTITWGTIEDQFQHENWQLESAATQHEVPNRALLIDTGKQRLFYSGDGRPTHQSIALMHKAEIIFQECACYDALPSDASHGDYQQSVALYRILGNKSMYLYHCWDEYRPMIQRAADKESHLHVSDDGLVLEI